MDQPAAWRLARWLPRKAGVDVGKLNPHSLRYSFVTAVLDAGVPLRDVQDAAGHADPARPAATTEHGTTSTVQ
jgi:integrase/recombinase XerD